MNNDAPSALLADADGAALRALLVAAFDAGYGEATGYAPACADPLIARLVRIARDAWYAQQEALRAQDAAMDADAPDWLLALPAPRPPIPGLRREE